MKTRKQLQFGMLDNVGATLASFVKDMSQWAKGLERDRRISHKWCIQDNRIQVIGDVDLRGMKIEYPFGVVGGFFLCDKDQEDSPNYPTHIGNKDIL